MKIITKLLCSIWVVTLLVMLSFGLPVGASGLSIAPIVYGEQMDVSIAYDGTSSSTFDYDSTSAHTANEKANRTRTDTAFGHFSEFLAAETTASQLEFGFVKGLSPKPAINWAKEAPNYGFAGDPAPATLVPGTTIDRFGIASGSYVSPTGTPFIQRSLAPGTQYAPYNIYNVLKPIDVQAGQIAPAFGMPGGGMQYKLPSSVQSLINSGHLGLGN